MTDQLTETEESVPKAPRMSKTDRDKIYHQERSLRLKRLKAANTNEVTNAEKALARAQERVEVAKSKVSDYDFKIDESDTFLKAFGITPPKFVAEDESDEASDAEDTESDSDEVTEDDQELEDVRV